MIQLIFVSLSFVLNNFVNSIESDVKKITIHDLVV